MTLFPAFTISESGADAMQAWIDTTAGNVANASDAEPLGSRVYAAQTPVFEPLSGPGDTGMPTESVEVAKVDLGTSSGVAAYQPTSPLADAQGEVAVPNVTLAEQMVGMISAEENYSANTAMMAKAQVAYSAALSIGT
jgi:flagellar basal-body rod protein FlgC